MFEMTVCASGSGDVAGAIEGTWKDASAQIKTVVNKVVFPAIDLPKSSTRRDDLLLTQEEIEANFLIRKAFNSNKSEEAVERIIETFRKTKSNQEFIQTVKKTKII